VFHLPRKIQKAQDFRLDMNGKVNPIVINNWVKDKIEERPAP
jgi:hypothetical protein